MRRILVSCAAVGIAAALVGTAVATTPSAARRSHVTRVTVVAKEFKFTLSKRVVRAGTVIFTVVNHGKVAHDFKVAGRKTPVLRPGKKATLKVVFRRGGRYAYLCTVPGHAAAGMKGSLTVKAAPRRAVAALRVSVAATEFRFKLSRSRVPLGTVAFAVTNRGKIAHDFRIAGKKTPLLKPGRSATLIVRLTKAGSYAYLCTLPGHAAAGMKGTLSVGSETTSSTVPPTTEPPSTTVAVGNGNTTVNVDMFEYRFELSQSSLPSGRVTFVVRNKGSEVHNFDLSGVKAGAIISPGATETWTVSLPPGAFGYECDVPFHADRGMTGQLTVTP